MQTLPNGIEVPTNSDTYKLTEHLANMGGTANVITKVANKAARDALPDPQAGDVVVRLDLVGCPLERYDGTKWTDGEQTPLIRQGVFTATTNSAGYATLVFSKPFPNGLTAGVVNDYSTSLGAINIKYVSGNASSINFRCYASTGEAIISTPVTVIYIATGN